MRGSSRSWRALGITVLAGTLLLGAALRRLGAADESRAERATVRRSQNGLNFELPPDWPIEKRNGVVGPVPIEEYLGLKFKALESRLQTLEQEVGSLDVRLRVMEEAVKRAGGPAGLRSSDAPAPVNAGP